MRLWFVDSRFHGNDEVGEAGRLDRHHCLHVAGGEGVHVGEDEVAGAVPAGKALAGDKPTRYGPQRRPLDSGLRRSDEMGWPE